MDDRRSGRPALSRREVIAAAGASALALSAGSGFAPPIAVARGTVFEDRTGNGVRRAGDPGPAGVLVSNGRDVVATDAEGRWALPVAQGEAVFVVKPPNWITPVGDHGLPRFSYLHQPLGSRPDRAPGSSTYHQGSRPSRNRW